MGCVAVVTTPVVLGLAVATLVAFGTVGILATRGRVGGWEEFVVARDSAGPGTTTATLIASVMGVWILLSPAEAGAAFGGIAAVAGYAIGEALPLLAYSWVGPRIRELVPEGHALTEYVHARYGPAMYGFVLLISLLYMFVFLAAELTGITTAFAEIADVPRLWTALLVAGAALAYTAYGGLRASLVTDLLQTLLVLPLLLLVAGGLLWTLGGTGAVHRAIVATDPSLLDPTFAAGVRFGIWVGIAILGAELVNQTWWQRVYAARDPETLARGFRVAALANAAIVFLAGLLGVIARGTVELVTDPASGSYDASVATFVLLDDVAADPVTLGVALLALALVMSTADSLFSAITSLVTADLPRLLSDPTDRALLVGARLLTVGVAVAAVLVSLHARSVLRLFLFADLLGVAVMIPIVGGLYAGRPGGAGALLASVAALAVGVAYFPDARPVLAAAGLAGPLPDPDFLRAFAGAALVSGGLTAAAAVMTPDRVDLETLAGPANHGEPEGER